MYSRVTPIIFPSNPLVPVIRITELPKQLYVHRFRRLYRIDGSYNDEAFNTMLSRFLAMQSKDWFQINDCNWLHWPIMSPTGVHSPSAWPTGVSVPLNRLRSADIPNPQSVASSHNGCTDLHRIVCLIPSEFGHRWPSHTPVIWISYYDRQEI